MRDPLALVTEYGLALVFANVLVEQIGIPLPALPTLIVSGALVAEGRLSGAAVLAVAVVACVIADGAWYIAGRLYGVRILRLLCRISLSPDSCVRQTENQFERWGVLGLVFGKFIPGISTVAPPLAGAMKIGSVRFFVFNTLGCILWAGLAIGAGFVFHHEIGVVVARFEEFGAVAGALLVALLAAYIALKWWERRRFYKTMRVARITVNELRGLMKGGRKPVVVDVRSEAERKIDTRHIPGALAVDLEQIESHRGEFGADREIVFYCTCPNEASAAIAARRLMALGYRNVRPLLGGLEEWARAGYEIEMRG